MDLFENGKMKKTLSGRTQLCFITGKKKKKRPENPPITESFTKAEKSHFAINQLAFFY